MRGLIVGCTIMMCASAAFAESDTDRAFKLGEMTKGAKVIMDYKLDGWNQHIDMNISSLLPGDARTIAEGVCMYAKTMGFSRPWTVRIFLVQGDRPAAECPTG